MYAKGISRETLETAAFRIGADIDLTEEPERNRIRFTIKKLKSSNTYRKFNPSPVDIGWRHPYPNSKPYVKGGWKERKTNSVCFHGHYAFFKLVFELEGNPDAIIESGRQGKSIYTPDTLRERAQKHGMRTLGPPGNIYHAWQYRELCHCADNDPNPEGIY